MDDPRSTPPVSREAPSHAESLRKAIDERRARVGVIGMGYVGLPLSLAFVDKGFSVLGFDVDPGKVASLNAGESYISHLEEMFVRKGVEEGRLEGTSDFARLAEPDALLICVPTPLTGNREPDMQYIERTVQLIANALRPGQLVVLESTTYPGTTEELVKPALEQSGLVCGRDFFLAFSPEREDPGNPKFSTAVIPKVVGGVDEVSTKLADALYGAVVAGTVPVSSARAAEASKLTENIFRSVNIALVNELKLIYESMGIDVWEVLDAAETKPFGFMRFDPGPGWGGHCIPIDPYYLSWKAREYGRSARFIELAGEINTGMPEHVVGRVVEALNEAGKAASASRVLVLGLAYKPDVADDRESPSYHIMDGLSQWGVEVDYHDPHVPEIQPSRRHSLWAGKKSVGWSEKAIRGYDAIVIATHHAAVPYHDLARWARCIVDTRNAMRDVDVDPDKLWKA